MSHSLPDKKQPAPIGDERTVQKPKTDDYKTNGTDTVRDRLHKTTEKKRGWITDIVIIVLIIGMCFVIWQYAIRPLMKTYEEQWDEMPMTYVLELTDVNPAYVSYDDEGAVDMNGQHVWSNLTNQADDLGQVVQTETVEEDGEKTGLTLRLTITAKVRYRKDKGYRIGETYLLCGERRTFRLYGCSADGIILAMNTAEEEK